MNFRDEKYIYIYNFDQTLKINQMNLLVINLPFVYYIIFYYK